MILTRLSRDQRGETLAELLVAIVIVGVAVAVIVGGLSTGVLVSDAHRKQTTADVLVKTWAEAIKNANYVNSGGCGNVQGSYSFTTLLGAGAVPAGFSSPALPTVSTWNGSAWGVASGNACNNAPIEKITLTVKSADLRDSESVDIVRLLQ
jgi:prepilin-type N-terminal cleavage/methylation domain-containing protein